MKKIVTQGETIAAIAQLGQQFPEDPETVKFLKERAVADQSKYVRRTAIELLEEEFAHDFEVQEFLNNL